MAQFLIILLCFAIPLEGIASLIVVKTPCPAESIPAKIAKATGSNGDHACCNDADTVVKTGKSCKAEKECQPATQALMPSTDNLLLASFGGEQVDIVHYPTLNILPSSTWRPPNRFLTLSRPSL